MFGVLRAGLTVVNVNPLYTPRELRHQLRDSGAKAIVVLENFAHTLAQVRSDTSLEHIIITAVAIWQRSRSAPRSILPFDASNISCRPTTCRRDQVAPRVGAGQAL